MLVWNTASGGNSFPGANMVRESTVSAQVGYFSGLPVTLIAREALSGEIPAEVARDGNLSRRKVVVMAYVERSLPMRPDGKWPLVDLPGKPAAAPAPAH